MRKRALTAASSSRWAGAITRISEDQVRRAGQNLRADRTSLLARIRRIEARLARVERQLEAGAVSVVRGGKALLRKRGSLAVAGLTQAKWREQWESARLFLTADGEAAKTWGNETIRWHPDEGWLEIKLPAPLAYLANQPHGRYRLSCPVAFSYRGDGVAAQTPSLLARPGGPLAHRRLVEDRPAAPWTSCEHARWWLSTSTTVTSPSQSSRRTATSWAPQLPFPSAWPGCRPPPATGACAPPSAH